MSKFCFNGDYDSAIRNAMRYGQKVDDVLKHADVEAEWRKVISGGGDKEEKKEGDGPELTDQDKLEASDLTADLQGFVVIAVCASCDTHTKNNETVKRITFSKFQPQQPIEASMR